MGYLLSAVGDWRRLVGLPQGRGQLLAVVARKAKRYLCPGSRQWFRVDKCSFALFRLHCPFVALCLIVAKIIIHMCQMRGWQSGTAFRRGCTIFCGRRRANHQGNERGLGELPGKWHRLERRDTYSPRFKGIVRCYPAQANVYGVALFAFKPASVFANPPRMRAK